MSNAWSQMPKSFRQKQFIVDSDTCKVDSISIIPNTFFLFNNEGRLINDSLYRLIPASSQIIIHESLKNQTLKASYQTFAIDFSKKYFHKNPANITPTLPNLHSAYTYSLSNENNDFFAKDRLDKRGSISRGISFGNNQDVIVNSNLNIQLAGKLSDDIEILAAISDNNIPIQPDGNSQQIQEFDKVFIKLFNKRTSLIVGDFEISKPQGYFLNLNKKGQGGLASTSFGLGKKKENVFKTTVSGAISKGKYNRMTLQGIEGNQGPYKMKGAENESYIIILAGSEKIYIDGKILKRGQENDYVIDYNTAEITFTPHQPITKDRRIVFEFEYSDKNYARFMIYTNNELITKKGKFWVNAFSEQDSKNQPIDQSLTKDEKQLLSTIGDSLQLALTPNIDSLEQFTDNLILYKKIDTLVNGTLYQNVYIHSVNPDSAKFKLGFSNVGENHGNYRQITQSTFNGKVFEWVAPLLGIPQGSYEPVVLLVTPKKKQMLTLGGETFLSPTTKMYFEGAMSNNDLNTFSAKNSSDDQGYAFKFGLKQRISITDTTKLLLYTSLNYQFVNKNFEAIDRFRSVEFERDWSLPSVLEKKDENQINFNAELLAKQIGSARYDFDYMNRAGLYDGIKNALATKLEKGGFSLIANGSLLNSSDTLSKISFLRHNATLSKTISSITFGVKEEQEINNQTRISNDSLLANSFSFTQYEAFINNSDTSKIRLFANYKNRKDYKPNNNKLVYNSLGEDFNIGSQFLKNPNNTLRTTLNYRTLNMNDSLKKENSITARIEHSLSILKGVISTSTFYEISSGLEIKKEFQYLDAGVGKGTYMWNDYNNNGVKELDEFEIAAPSDQAYASYIRIYTPTNDYTKTYSNQFNQVINLNPSKIWRKEKGIKNIIARFSDQLTYQAGNKTTNSNFEKYANPFYNSSTDSSFLTISTSIRNTFSFNKSNSVFGFDYVFLKNDNRILLVNGVETRTNRMDGARLRWNISQSFSFVNNLDYGEKNYESQFFTSRNYKIPYLTNNASISYQYGMIFRLTIAYKYTQKENSLGIEKAVGNDFGLEGRYNVASKGNFSAKINYIKFDYNSASNTSIAYEMLEGLLPGDNITWGIVFQRNLSNYLQLDLNYNGRKSGTDPIIHTGGIQIRAIF